MNNFLKISVAGALALGYVSAHAGAVVPTSSNPGDVFLFADVISGGNVVKAFAADTTVSVNSATGGTAFGTLYAIDGNLSSLIAANTAGTTLQWAVIGGGGDSNGDQGYTYVTTDTNSSLGTLVNRTGVNVAHWFAGFNNTASLVNGLTGANASVVANSPAGAGGWDPTILTSNASNWFSNGPTNLVTGLNSSAALYGVTAISAISTVPVGTTVLGNVSLTTNGLSFTASTVPLPAAVWLLGSGLLGLAGVGRRKLKSAV
jgi:hypothetical protein